VRAPPSSSTQRMSPTFSSSAVSANMHLFTDDMQGVKHSKPSNVRDVTAGLGACVTSVNNRCASKRLRLNTKKTEVMWFGSAINLRKISSVDKDILVGSDIISPSSVVRDLGVFFDSELNMKSHISQKLKLKLILKFI